MINLLIVDDSAVARTFLNYIFSLDPDIRVVGIARSGIEALELVKRNKPNVISMDIHMPVMDGFETTRKIMETFPTPIVLVSQSMNITEVSIAYKSIEAGALACVARPVSIDHPDFEKGAKELIQTIKLMSEVKLVRRWAKKEGPTETHTEAVAKKNDFVIPANHVSLLAIGASTGGPSVILEILSGISKNIPFPVLITQHMSPGFEQGFADWLSHSSGLPVSIAMHEERPVKGHVYLAPTNFNMGVNAKGQITLSKAKANQHICPSIDFLFQSVSRVYGGSAVAIILSGMGSDGACGMKLLYDKGAVTIAQDEKSCVVYGMPKEAINAQAVKYVLPPTEISEFINSII